MTDLEVFRLSAKMCGYTASENDTFGVVWILSGNDCEPWNPFTNPAQRDECRRKLLKRGDIRYSRYGVNRFWDGADKWAEEFVPTIEIACPMEEFDARALAEIGRKG